MSDDKLSRREMLRHAALAGLGLAGAHVGAVEGVSAGALESLIAGPPPAHRSMIEVPFERHETVRLAVVGTGLRGRGVLREFLNVPGVQVTGCLVCGSVA